MAYGLIVTFQTDMQAVITHCESTTILPAPYKTVMETMWGLKALIILGLWYNCSILRSTTIVHSLTIKFACI